MTTPTYKFYKIFPSGKKKYCEPFNSTLDPNYHAYINWCEEHNKDNPKYPIGWELVRTFDNKVMFTSKQQ